MVGRKHTHAIVLLLALALLSSCASLGLEKRRYRRGYHVHSFRAAQPVNRVPVEADRPESVARIVFPEREIDSEPEPIAAASLSHDVVFTERKLLPFLALKVRSGKDVAQFVHPDKSEVVVGSSVQEKRPWNVKSIVAFALGVLGFLMLPLTTTAANFGFLGAFWVVPALLGITLGIAALILAVKARKEIRNDGSRGKGFALTGFIAGITSIVAGFVVGLIFLMMFFLG